MDWPGVVPVNAKLHPAEAEWIVNNAQARWAFVTRDVAPRPLADLDRQVEIESVEADELRRPLGHEAPRPAERLGNDLAWLFYTSGTTGRPKGVMLTQRNLMTMGLGYFVDVDPIAAHDAMVCAAPMSHVCGIYAIPHLMAGGRHVVPPSGGVDPAELFALGRALGPLSTFASPTIVKRLVDHAHAQGLGRDATAASFKTIVYRGAPMYLADIGRAPDVMGLSSCRSTAKARRRWSAPRCLAADSPRLRKRDTSSGWRRSKWHRPRFRSASPMRRAPAWPRARSARSWCVATR